MKERKTIKDRFKDKVAIITGGSSGIGKAVLEEICKEGASAVFTGTRDTGHQIVKDMTTAGFNVVYCQGDMASEQFCRDVAALTRGNFGKVNYLFNNAFSFTAKALDASRDDWERIMQVGPLAFALMGTLVADSMRAQGGGSIGTCRASRPSSPSRTGGPTTRRKAPCIRSPSAWRLTLLRTAFA